MFNIKRGRPLGDDAAPTGAPRNCFNWNAAAVELLSGVVNEYPLRIDATASVRVAAAELTGEIFIALHGSFVTGGLVDPNMSSFASLTLTLRDHAGLKTVVGTPQQIMGAVDTLGGASAFSTFPSGLTSAQKVSHIFTSLAFIRSISSLADNAAISWKVPHGTSAVEMVLHHPTDPARGHLGFFGGAWSIYAQPSGQIETSTSALTGTTGTDGKLTVSYSGGRIYVENRLGSAYSATVVPRYFG